MTSKPLVLSALMAAMLFLASLAAGADKDGWVEVDSPNFRVISDAGEKKAQEVAVQFETIRAVFRQALVIASNHPSPIITVIAVKDEKALSELLPEYWAAKGHAHPAGLFYGGLDKTYVALRLDATGNSAYETLYHEYYHSLTVPYFVGLPLWVVEGTAEFFGHVEIVGKEVRLGVADPNLLQYLQQEHLLPISTLLQVDSSSPYYNEQNKTSIFYAESWALIHYFMLGDNSAHRNEYADYLRRIGNNEPQEQAAHEAFGDLNELQKQLSSYTSRSSYSMYTMKTPEIESKKFPVRKLSEADVDVVQGDSSLRRHRFDEAEPLLKKALLLDSQSVSARESMGFLEYWRGNRDESARWMTEAIDLNSQDYLVYYYRSLISMESHATESATVERAENDVRHCIALNPNFAPAYSMLGTWESAEQDKWSDAVALGEKAVQLEPGNSRLQLNLGRIFLRTGRVEDAMNAGRISRISARSVEERGQAEAFLNSVQQFQRGSSANVVIEGPKVSAANAPSSVTEATEQSTAPEPATPESYGALETADGNIREEACSKLELTVVLMQKSQAVSFHSANYFKVEYWSSDGKSPENFNPCQDLKGLHVHVSFAPVLGSGNVKEIRKIEIIH